MRIGVDVAGLKGGAMEAYTNSTISPHVPFPLTNPCCVCVHLGIGTQIVNREVADELGCEVEKVANKDQVIDFFACGMHTHHLSCSRRTATNRNTK
jgi:hypothetical protein